MMSDYIFSFFKMLFTFVILLDPIGNTPPFLSVAGGYERKTQLKILKQNKLVKSRRDGKSIFYSLADEHVVSIIAQGREHIEED